MSSDSRKPMDDSATGQGKFTSINLGSSSAALPTAAGGPRSGNSKHSTSAYRGGVQRSNGDDGSQHRTPAFHGEPNRSGREDRESDVSQRSTTSYRGGSFRQDRQSNDSQHGTTSYRGGSFRQDRQSDDSQHSTTSHRGGTVQQDRQSNDWQYSTTGYRGGTVQQDRQSNDSQHGTTNFRGGSFRQDRQSDVSKHSSSAFRGGVKRAYGDDGSQNMTPAFHGELNRLSREDHERDVSQRGTTSYRGGTAQHNRQSDVSQHSTTNYRGGSVQQNRQSDVSQYSSTNYRGGSVQQSSTADVHRSPEPPQARPPTEEVQKSTVPPAMTMPPPPLKMPSFLGGRIPSVSYVESPIEKEHIKRVVSRYVRAKNSHLFAASQPEPIEVVDGVEGRFKQLSERLYYVTWMAEGERCLVLIEDKGRVWLVDSANNIFSLKQLHFPKRRGEHLKDTLIEAEVVIDKIEGGGEVPRMLITDIIRLEGKDLGNMRLLKRIEVVKDKLIEPRIKLKRDNECMEVRYKEWYGMDATRKIVSPEFQRKVPHRIDGLLFKARDESYASGHLLEWKFPKASDLDDAQTTRKKVTWEDLDSYISTLPPEERK